MTAGEKPQSLAVVAFVGASGAGKTTLLGSLVKLFRETGLRVGVIKHTHHDVQPDQPGKDSRLMREAGAEQVLLAGPRHCALFTDSPGRGQDPQLQDLIRLMNPADLDLILVEGMKYANVPKVEVHRDEVSRDWLYPDDPQIFAVVSDDPLPAGERPASFTARDPQALVALIQRIIPRT